MAFTIFDASTRPSTCRTISEWARVIYAEVLRVKKVAGALAQDGGCS